MTTRRVTFTIPEPPKDASPQLRQMLAAMKEAVEVRLGRRGDPLEEGVTKRDLVESGIAKLGGQGGSGPLQPVVVEPSEARIIPPAPQSFSAEGVYGGISLSWESPFQQYNVHAFAEVWRSDTPDPATRVLLDSSRGGIYFDRIPDGQETKFYYWIRFVSEYDKEGPFSAMVAATKLRDVTELMAEISGYIDESDLSKAFNSTLTDIKEGVSTATTDIGGLKSQYTLRLNVNGYISGYGAYNDGATAQFAILADAFWIAPPGSTGKIKPFIVDNGEVYMDSAVIRDASIQEGKLGPITFGKLVDQTGKPVTTVSGKLLVDLIDVTSLRVTDANISGVIKSTQVDSKGQPRWMLDKNGGMAFNSSNGNGRMEIRDNVMKFFDSAGRLRVQLGDLSL